ncbi:MAG: hypothetical protein ACXW0Q_15320 [Methylovulum sp.]
MRGISDNCHRFDEHKDELWLRIQTGFWLHQQQTEQCYRQLKVLAERVLSPDQIRVKLLLDKAGGAFGHHSKIRLGNKSLDDWFAQSPFDGEGFLAALRQSSYIDPTNPAESRRFFPIEKQRALLLSGECGFISRGANNS